MYLTFTFWIWKIIYHIKVGTFKILSVSLNLNVSIHHGLTKNNYKNKWKYAYTVCKHV